MVLCVLLYKAPHRALAPAIVRAAANLAPRLFCLSIAISFNCSRVQIILKPFSPKRPTPIRALFAAPVAPRLANRCHRMRAFPSMRIVWMMIRGLHIHFTNLRTTGRLGTGQLRITRLEPFTDRPVSSCQIDRVDHPDQRAYQVR